MKLRLKKLCKTVKDLVIWKNKQIGKPLAILVKRRKTQINGIKNEKDELTTYHQESEDHY